LIKIDLEGSASVTAVVRIVVSVGGLLTGAQLNAAGRDHDGDFSRLEWPRSPAASCPPRERELDDRDLMAIAASLRDMITQLPADQYTPNSLTL
jgi:hypothetical protein